MPQYSTSHRNNAMADLISQAGIAAFILLYSGALPASCAAADSGALLSAIPCNPVIGTVNNGVLTFNGTATAAPASASNPLGPAVATAGAAVHWRLCTNASGASVVAQGTIGAFGSELIFPAGTTFLSGQLVSLIGMTITAAGV